MSNFFLHWHLHLSTELWFTEIFVYNSSTDVSSCGCCCVMCFWFYGPRWLILLNLLRLFFCMIRWYCLTWNTRKTAKKLVGFASWCFWRGFSLICSRLSDERTLDHVVFVTVLFGTLIPFLRRYCVWCSLLQHLAQRKMNWYLVSFSPSGRITISVLMLKQLQTLK